ncbi:MAG: hypothetical protein COB10_09015, partial [Planctomycetota bacterium]
MGDYTDYARDSFETQGSAADVGKGQKKDVVFGLEEAMALNAVNYPVNDNEDTSVADPVVTAIDTTKAVVQLGRGLDIGTANLVSSFQDNTGNVNLKIQRNAFIDIDCDDYTKNMLTRLGVQYVVV